jgi:hypothetical protein
MFFKNKIIIMFKTRVKFRVRGKDVLQIGYLIKDKSYGGFKVKSSDNLTEYGICILDILERI